MVEVLTMRLIIDRQKKIILLGWLKQGYIDTLDLPEAYKDSTFFLELLKESCCIDDSQQTGEACEASTMG